MALQTGTVYKAAVDASLAAALSGFSKRRNVNGDGRVNQLVTGVALSGSWQYILDMWEAELEAGTATGTFGQTTDAAFPAGVAIGATNLATSSTGVILGFRTKMESANVADLASAASTAFLFPVQQVTQHPYACVGGIFFQNSGASVTVTPVLRSADATNNFSTMTNSLTGLGQTLPSGALTALFWEGANAFQMDTLTNAKNGLCLEFQLSGWANGLSGKTVEIGDVSLEGGQICSYYSRTKLREEILECERQYWKTFLLGTAPAQNIGTNTGELVFPGVHAGATAQQSQQVRFPVQMIKTPAMTAFNPSATNAQVRDESAIGDCSATGVTATAAGFYVNCTGNAGTVLASVLGVHLTADARL